MAVRDSWLAYNQPVGCIGVHCNLRVRSYSFIVTLLSLGIFSSLLQYDFRIQILGSSHGAILIIVPTLVFEKVSIYMRILTLMLML
jgi:hypothetical protein